MRGESIEVSHLQSRELNSLKQVFNSYGLDPKILPIGIQVGASTKSSLKPAVVTEPKSPHKVVCLVYMWLDQYCYLVYLDILSIISSRLYIKISFLQGK
jgi:hypothetical protein